MAATPSFGAMKAALLLEHAGDMPFNSLLCAGFEQAARQNGIEAEVIVAPQTGNQTEVFRSAAQSHDLVIVATDAMHEILRDNAANFRRVMFGCIDTGIRAPNIMSVTFADEQAAFLAGAAAAMTARAAGKPVIGWLSGCDTPAMRSLFSGYSEGALLAVPGCRVIQTVVQSFTDPETSRTKAQWLLDSGAQVIALAAGTGNTAAASAILAAKAAIIDVDAPASASHFGVITKALDRAAAQITNAAAKKFQGKEIVRYDLQNNGVNFALTPGPFSNKDVMRRLTELRQELINGNIHLHSLRQRTLCDCLD